MEWVQHEYENSEGETIENATRYLLNHDLMEKENLL